MTGQTAIELCKAGYNELWFDNQGNKSKSCYGFEDSAAGWLASPLVNVSKKPGKWTLTWRMTSPEDETVLEQSYSKTVYPTGTVYLPDGAAEPTTVKIPDQVALECFEKKVIEPTTCGSDLVSEVGSITLGFKGITPEAIATLCGEGYTTQWTDNHGRHLSADGMLRGPETPIDGCMSAAAAASEYHPRFVPPTATGPWVITWKLYSPSGTKLLEAQYAATVVAP
jgi:hypothetical protein